MFNKTFIIAEAGANHNGDINLAKELIHAAKESGADAIKFQDFNLASLFSIDTYIKILNINPSWQKEIERISFKKEWHKILHEEAKKVDIQYFITPFSLDSVDNADPYVPFYKVASGDITFKSLLKKIGEKNKGIFISTGASNIEEIDRAIKTLESYNPPWICIMHCIMLYPTPYELLNLGFITTLIQRYKKYYVGFSDHSTGIEAPSIAVSLGARVIEKHFTTDKRLQGADHKNSLNPDEFKMMVNLIRKTEEMINGQKRKFTEKEEKERIYARRSIYAKRFIKQGEIISENDLIFLRPNIGIGAEEVDKIVGKKAKTDIYNGSLINYSDIT